MDEKLLGIVEANLVKFQQFGRNEEDRTDGKDGDTRNWKEELDKKTSLCIYIKNG